MRKTMSNNQIFVNISLLFAILLFCLVVLEIGIRILSPGIFHPSIQLVPNQNRTISVDLNGVSPVVNYSTNMWGFRGDPIQSNFSEHYSIMTIGGSTTQCYYLDDSLTWPYILQKNLVASFDDSIIVQNAGLDGYSSRGSLRMMEYVVPKVEPDMVIFLSGLNDMHLSLNPERFYKGSPYDEIKPIYWLFSKSRLVQILHLWYQVFFSDTVLVEQGHSNLVVKEMSQSESVLSAGFEDELISLEEYEKNVRETIRLGREQNVTMLFVTHPILFYDSDEWRDIEGSRVSFNGSEYYISARTVGIMLDVFNDRLLEICEGEKVECFDLASYMPHDSRYYYGSAHFNELGASFVARSITGYIRANRMITP
ncbi:MAG: SGNH/GDSL hydrolase family protein [Candidatus Aenigmarchaeota archaeon]|nr:SGNH/GDSL hydrolase family protein [Candidatus Aenigmarchaeota archaeon]